MRQFVLPSFPESGGSVILSDRDFRYLVQVLRKDTGDIIEARLPDGSLCSFRVSSIDRRAKRLSLFPADGAMGAYPVSGMPAGENGPALPSTPLPGSSMPAPASVPADFPRIALFQWILKGPRMDQVIRQATETGVEAIVPVAGERCVADEAGMGRLTRWGRIVREARQQSGSPIATRILPALAPADIPESWAELSGGERSSAIVFTEAPLARKALHGYLCGNPGVVALAVGPEGGMSARELDILSGAGFEYVHFKTNVLRAETCALYGIAAVQNALTEFESWQSKE